MSWVAINVIALDALLVAYAALWTLGRRPLCALR